MGGSRREYRKSGGEGKSTESDSARLKGEPPRGKDSEAGVKRAAREPLRKVGAKIPVMGVNEVVL